jgi:hypothetical protein
VWARGIALPWAFCGFHGMNSFGDCEHTTQPKHKRTVMASNGRNYKSTKWPDVH